MLLTSNAEGGTSGTAYTAANTGGASGNAFDLIQGSGTGTFDNAHSAHGGLAYKHLTGGVSAQYCGEWGVGSVGTIPTIWGRVYVFFTALPAQTDHVAMWLSATGVESGRISIGTNGTVRVNDSVGSGVILSTVAITLNAWNRIEWTCTPATSTTGAATLWHYVGDSTTLVEAAQSVNNQNFGTASLTIARGGLTSSAANVAAYWTDDFAISGAGPIGPVAGYEQPFSRPYPPGRVGPWIRFPQPLPAYVSSAADTAAATNAPAECATATGVALDATVDLQVNAETTTAAGSAPDPVAAIGGNAEQTSATGVAYDAQVAVAVNAAVTTAAGTAPDPLAAIGVNAETTTATGTAFDATVSFASTAPAEATSATGTAYDATVSLGVSADVATATGAALDGAASAGVNAATTTAAGAAFDGTAAIAVNAEQTSATGTAFDATVSTTGTVNAPAEQTTATGTAYDATVSITVNAETTTAAGTAFAATVQIGALAGLTSATGTAFDALIALLVNAQAALAQGTAYDVAVAQPIVPGSMSGITLAAGMSGMTTTVGTAGTTATTTAAGTTSGSGMSGDTRSPAMTGAP